MYILSKKLSNKYEVYDVTVELDGKLHHIRVSVVNTDNYQFVRMGAGSHESISIEDFEGIKTAITNSFVTDE